SGQPADLRLSADAQLGHAAAVALCCLPALPPGSEASWSCYVRTHLCEPYQLGRELGAYLRPSWISSDGGAWIGALDLPGQSLHGCGSDPGRVEERSRPRTFALCPLAWSSAATHFQSVEAWSSSSGPDRHGSRGLR